LTPLALSALTDVILACEIFFLTGLSVRSDTAPWSAAWWWSVTLGLTGLSTMLGAIDHGFFEGVVPDAHAVAMFATRAVVAVASFTMLVSTARHFLDGGWCRIVTALGAAGLAVTLWQLWGADNFLIVVAAYSAVLVLTLCFHLVGLRNGSGSLWMCAAILLILGASVMVVLESEGLPGLGLFATYHILLMPAVAGLYLGGRHLSRTTRAAGMVPAQPAMT
jgi:hypothetical protein